MKKDKSADKKTKQSVEDQLQTEHLETDDAVDETVADKAETEADQVVEENINDKTETEAESLHAELSALNEKYLRLLAEYDNFRRRSKQEKEGLYTQSIQDVVTSFFPVIDNLERALPLISDEENKKGIDMVLRQAKEALIKFEVEEIEALGETFDPNIHSAILHVEDDQYGEQEIVEVFEKGYKRGNNVLRHSMVKVAN